MTSDGVNSYTWDRANRLTNVGGTAYAYDGEGRRIQQTVSSVVTKYLLDIQPGLSVILSQDLDGDVMRFVHAPRGIHAQETVSGWQWIMQDGLGSVRSVADDSLAVQWSGSPAPYGHYFGETGTRQTNYGFTGEYTDPTTELVHLRARYYSPNLGVFTSLDPVEFTNRYSYVNGNPVNYTDPSGLQDVGSNCRAQAANTPFWGDDTACLGVSLIELIILGLAGAATVSFSVNAVGRLLNANPGYYVSNPLDMFASETKAIADLHVEANCGSMKGYPQAYASCAAAVYAEAGLVYPGSGTIAVPQGDTGVVSQPSPYPDPNELWKVCNSGLCGALLLALLQRLIKTKTDNFERTRDRSDPEEFVGYHGTSSNFVASILTAISFVDLSNFQANQLGPGFYVTPEIDKATWYATRSTQRNGGSPEIFTIFARGFSKMRGAEVPPAFWFWGTLPFTLMFDYLTAPIWGLPGGNQIKFNPHTYGALRAERI